MVTNKHWTKNEQTRINGCIDRWTDGQTYGEEIYKELYVLMADPMVSHNISH